MRLTVNVAVWVAIVVVLFWRDRHDRGRSTKGACRYGIGFHRYHADDEGRSVDRRAA